LTPANNATVKRKDVKRMTEEAREARNAYKRQWNAKNPDKRREYMRRYWERKAAEKRREAAESGREKAVGAE
jgi:hypothetical protein